MILPVASRYISILMPNKVTPCHVFLVPVTKRLEEYASLMLSTTSCGVIDFS